jgi:arylsulfatase A-like enzyme
MNRRPRSLVLITIDCLRADHVGHLGYERPTTPFLDCLAKQSIVFRNAIAAGTPTYYSLPALLASRYPLALGRDLIGVAPDESTIASVLQESGFATAAFSAGNPYISAQFGYERGFDVFCDFLHDHELESQPVVQRTSALRSRANQFVSRMCHALSPLGSAYDELYFQYCQRRAAGRDDSLDSLRRFPSAEIVVDRALGWLNENSGRPFLMWLHLMDPHAPYFPKSEALKLMGDGQFAADEARYLNSYWARGDLGHRRLKKNKDHIIKLYDAGIRWVDEQVRRLTEKLVELNVWDQCALAVTADHGEEFLDHGGRFHVPVKLTQELVHVPLLLRVPDCAHAHVEQPISLMDLAPTLLEILELPLPADFHGRSCWTRLGKAGWDGPAITEAIYECSNPFHRENRTGPRMLAVRKGNYKLVINFSLGTEEFFDLQSDPHERNPIPSHLENRVHRDLLECARKHLAESHKSRDFDRRNASLLRDLRLEWAHPATSAPN